MSYSCIPSSPAVIAEFHDSPFSGGVEVSVAEKPAGRWG
jgi:hypothetical protein